MFNNGRLISLAARAYDGLPKLSGAAALLTRLFVGGFFVSTGWGKMHNLDQFAMNFAGWGIPYPHFNAALSAYTEFYGGLLTVAGLGTRFVAIPMIINMLVALFSVVLRFNVSSFADFLNTDEPLYVLTYIWLMISGGGWLSVDGLIGLLIGSSFEERGNPYSDGTTISCATPGIVQNTP